MNYKTKVLLLMSTFYILFAIGWVMNVIAVFNLPIFSQWTGMSIVRIIGVFLPWLGAILGYV